MKRIAIVVGAGLLAAACEAPKPPPAEPPPAWVYPPPPHLSPTAVVGAFGRGHAVELAPTVGIVAAKGAAVTTPLRLPTFWQVPGATARAVVYGNDNEVPSVDLIDIDAGTVLWRDRKNCAGPVVGATDTRVVCASVHGTRVLDLADGSMAWETTEPFLALDDDRVTIAGVGEISIRTVEAGDELAHLIMPAGVLATSVVATCGAGEVYATDAQGRLARAVATAKGKPMALAWTAPIAQFARLDACGTGPILVTRGDQLFALARDTGKVIGTVDRVRGWWTEGDRVIVTARTATLAYPRDLSTPTATALPPLYDVVATFGEHRLVRASALAAAWIDRSGVIAYVPFGEMGGALGASAFVAGTWQISLGETVHRRLLPPATTPRPPLTAAPLPPAPPPVVPAELRDLPAVAPTDEAHLVVGARDGVAMHTVGGVAIDPADPGAIYAVTLEQQPDDTTHSGLARADLATHAWRWVRGDGCGRGRAVAIAIARDVVTCAAHASSPGTATIIATDRATGAARWTWRGDNVDAVAAAGDLVLAYDADRAIVIDARTGTQRGYFASDDGATVRAAAVARGVETWLATAERGTVTLRLPLAGMAPVAAFAVRGVVRGLTPAQDGVLVELDDGDAYRIDLATLRAVAIPAPGMELRASAGELLASGPGGPIYADAPPPAPVVAPKLPPRPPQPQPAQITPPAPMSNPDPPRAVIDTAWQLAVIAPDGGVIARDDYRLPRPVMTGPRGPGAPVVALYGGGYREAIVVDARTGDPLRRTRLPDTAPLYTAFATRVDGAPIVGVVLSSPLRIAPL